MKIEGLKVFVQILKRMYKNGRIDTEKLCQMCEKRVITPEQFKEITGKDY